MPRKRPLPNFKTTLEELEQIVERLENEDISLEASLKDFERGIKLTQSCQEALKQAEQKVEQLINRGDHDGVEPLQSDD